eukprot:1065604-Amphidinium_carterae.1
MHRRLLTQAENRSFCWARPSNRTPFQMRDKRGLVHKVAKEHRPVKGRPNPNCTSSSSRAEK